MQYLFFPFRYRFANDVIHLIMSEFHTDLDAFRDNIAEIDFASDGFSATHKTLPPAIVEEIQFETSTLTLTKTAVSP